MIKEFMKPILTIKDSCIYNIEMDKDSIGGCPTCDYGSKYTNEITIELKYKTVRYKVSNMYEYYVTEGDVIYLILNNIGKIINMTEDEFIEWFHKSLENNDEYKSDTFKIEYEVFD